MRGEGILRTQLVASINMEMAANALKATKTPDELISVWWRDCDGSTGEVRERLQEVYADKLKSLGAMHC